MNNNIFTRSVNKTDDKMKSKKRGISRLTTIGLLIFFNVIFVIDVDVVSGSRPMQQDSCLHQLHY